MAKAIWMWAAAALVLTSTPAAAFPPSAPGAEPVRKLASVPRSDREEKTGPGDWLQKFPGPQAGFLIRLQGLCDGARYAGRLVSDDAADADMRGETMVMGPARCTVRDGRLDAIAIPFTVGDDASRTWLISRTDTGLKLRHRHLMPDGTEDPVSQYGGVAEGGGTFTRQAFPADAETKALFDEAGIPQSKENVWAVEVVPGDSYAYEMKRADRMFRAEFDLMRPLPGREADDQAAR